MIQKVKKGTRIYYATVLTLFFFSGSTLLFAEAEDNQEVVSDEEIEEISQPSINFQRRISDIIVHGNNSTSTDAILNNVPYKIGELFDPRKTKTLIRNL